MGHANIPTSRNLPNYINTFLRDSFTEDDLANGGSDRLVDAIVVWGDEARIKERLDTYFAAGGPADREGHAGRLASPRGRSLRVTAVRDTAEVTPSEPVRRHLASARVEKAFNNIDFPRLSTGARPAGAPDRSALPVAGDDPQAKETVSRLLDVLGYDAVDTGLLADSWRTEPGTPVYVRPYMAERPEGLSEEEAKR
ncbi:hypothetical protein [Streptomyces sp. NPDC048277]|uniref:NADPH-dependent F420 reductase n=1 Tax=Streptomyces sp. NPDC048277 TaxID=3155027 RepID=UPI0033CE505F